MAIVNPSSSSIYPIDKRMNAYDIEIEYDEENDNYYAEHEFTYPSKRVRLNIDTENSLWPTDESNSMTITIPSTPQTDTNNTWDDTTKTLTLTNLDQNTLITNNQNPSFNYATDLNINLLNYQSTPSSIKINISSYTLYQLDSTLNPLNLLKDMTLVTSSQSISLGTNSSMFWIHEENNRYRIYLNAKSSNTSTNTVDLQSGDRYVITNKPNSFLYLYDNNNNVILELNDWFNDNFYSYVYLYKSTFNLIFD